MNAHIPQSYEASTELAEIAAVPHQIVTPRHAKPLIGIVQDTLVGSYRITRPQVEFTRSEFMNMMMWNKRFEGRIPRPVRGGEGSGPARWNGQQVLSQLMPPINMEMGNGLYKDNKAPENLVKIREGQVLQGIFDKDIFSKPSKGIVHTTFRDYGSKETVNFIDAMQNTVEQFLVYNGFSVGISDLIADKETREQMEEIVKKRKAAIENILLQIHLDLFDNNTGKSNQQEFEDKVFAELNKATEESGKIGLSALSDENRLVAMVRAGSKGSTINISQMMACVGQQAPEGKRIPYGFTDRTLPHFKKYDDGAEARGFVESSFIQGLTPQEFFFHAMSGREGLIDTAVKSVTGDTEIIIVENGQSKYVQIGPWIDGHLAAAKQENIERYKEANMELLNLENEVYIPTCDEHGKASWGRLTAVTRHDPGECLYEIKTLSGRSVTVAKSKSLIIWDEAKQAFLPKDSSEVVKGDLIPVSAYLQEAPIVTTHIDMANYLSKEKYVYGSDFLVAKQEMQKAMEGREHIPAGWWNENNGKLFTLPYPNKARFQRAANSGRTDITNIEDGYVYAFAHSRKHPLPGRLELNERNGIFMGLYLAEGNADIPSGYVQISNNDPKIRKFVMDWFDDMGIIHRERFRTVTTPTVNGGTTTGTSNSVRGYSKLLGEFLKEFLGSGSANKFVPNEAFTAPKEFICGLLNGYFSGDGTVDTGGISALSVSKKLIEGISFLCSRIGVFGKISSLCSKSNNVGTAPEKILETHTISIRSHWASTFVKQVPFIHDGKQERANNLKCSLVHKNFEQHNDVVKDKVVEINCISTEGNPKLYDVTVPSTLNFQIANGTICQDTADTGYIQRQLVKAMEDLTVQYDGSVRDSRMNVVQFKYGEDGVNATKIESTGLGLAKLSEAEIRKEFGLEGDSLVDVLAEGVMRGEDTEALRTFAESVLADRKMLVEGIQKSRQTGEIYTPVNLERVLTNVAISFRLDKQAGRTDLTPSYVLAGIDRLIQSTQHYHKLWTALLRFYLAPHKLIKRERFTRKAFDTVCEMIITKNWQSWVQPGEQVGIIAAQSIGEPSTQMSTVKTSLVHIREPSGRHYFGPVGVYLDEILKNAHSKVRDLGGDSVVLDMEQDYYIVSVSQDEKTAWKRISQISRHPANGGLVKVTTRSGRTTTATLSHSFLRRSAKGIVPVLGSDLRLGMRIPIARRVPTAEPAVVSFQIGEANVPLDREFGWLCGMYLADGSFDGNHVSISKVNPVVEAKMSAIGSKYGWEFTSRMHQGEHGLSKENRLHSKELKEFLAAHFSTGSYAKTIAGDVYGFPRDFIAGLLTGYFDGDGNVNVERQQIRVGSRSEELIRHINRLFSYRGFFTVLGSETSVRIPGKTMYTLNVLKKDARRFRDELGGFSLPEKAAALEGIIAYIDRADKHDTKELYDKIPELGECIAETGRLLRMPGQSRMYGRWLKKESVGRLTLETYVADFKQQFTTLSGTDLLQQAEIDQITENIATLDSALTADVVWDEIVDLEILEDPKEYVYDFTVPGNESFMVDDCILVHNTLNTFHLAGVAAKSNVTRGVPRLKELLKVTQNPTAISLTVPLKPEYRESREKARKVAQDLELTLLKDITVKAAIYYDPNEEDTVLEEDRDLIKFYRAFEAEVDPAKPLEERFVDQGVEAEVGGGAADTGVGRNEKDDTVWSRLMLRFELDRELMFQKDITMDDIAFVLRTKFGEAINLIYSDYNSQKLVMRVRIPTEIREGEGTQDDLMALKKLQHRLLTGIVVRGVPGIKAVTFRQDKDVLELNPEDGTYKQVTQYVLDTDGTNFLAVMSHPYVDGTKVTSSHVHDIYGTLGIEAARATLIQEITTLFEEAGVNNRHLGLLCDVMTRGGRLMSVDRYGINKMDIGPLAKASFEETEKILLHAALFGEMDPITGISANIMMGQPIRGGTSFFNVLFDEQAFMRLQEGLPPTEAGEEEEAEPDAPTQEQINAELYQGADDLCSTARLRMNVMMPQMATLLEEPDVDITLLDGDDAESEEE